jgi:hypothetical protein
MIKELLTQLSSLVYGLPFFSEVGVKKTKPVTLPVLSCPTLRKGTSPGEAIATIIVAMKNTNMAQLYDEVESVISALTLPGFVDWRTASVVTGTDGHYAEVVFEAVFKTSRPSAIIPTAAFETFEASYVDP